MKKKVANRIIAECEAINGSKIIFPSTFGETKDSDFSKSKSKINNYRHNFVNLDKKTGKAEAVLVDSVGSFANRIERCLIEKDFLPRIKINIDGVVEVDANTLPHRIYDAVVRDTLLNGIPWRQSEIGKMLLSSNINDATALFKYAPLTLLFGGWDSMGGDAVTGTKIARSVACEIWGKNVQALIHTAHRINPFPSASESGNFAMEKDSKGNFSCRILGTEKEINEAKKNKTFSKLSECGHGSAFTASPKGCIVEQINFSGAISLTRLNRYQFPGEGGSLKDRNEAARNVLANLALFGISKTLDQLDLRSGCELYTTSRDFQTIFADGQIEILDISYIEDDLIKSINNAKSVGLEFCEVPIVLEPSETLKKIVRMREGCL